MSNIYIIFFKITLNINETHKNINGYCSNFLLIQSFTAMILIKGIYVKNS